jgi:single-strand DNA-binding protein
MSKSINRVFLLGNVGQEPDVYQTRDGIVVNLTLATDESFNVNGEWRDRTEWHNLVAFQRKAEVVRDYVRKGSKILVEGKLHTEQWDDKETGEPRSKTKIVVLDLTLLSSPQAQSQSNGYAKEAETAFPGYGSNLAAGALTSADIPF